MRTLLYFSLCMFPLFANAEVHSCSGVFTNKPCEEVTTEPSASESISIPTPTSKMSELSTKKSLLHELTMKSLRYKKQYKVEVDVSAAGNECLADDKNLAACREAISKLDDKLEARKVQAIANELNEKKLAVETTLPGTASNGAQRNVVIINRSYGYGYPFGSRNGYGLNSIPSPQSHFPSGSSAPYQPQQPSPPQNSAPPRAAAAGAIAPSLSSFVGPHGR